ncbi:MAG: hypothetical protein WAU59_10675, partial [Rhodoplanes sp.]
LEAAAHAGGPRVVAFVHIPPLRVKALPRRAEPQRRTGNMHALARLTRVSEAMLIAIRTMLPDISTTRRPATLV